jgi:sialidase-1
MRTGVVLAVVLALTAAARAAGPTKVDVFEAGTGGYETYRIPGLVVTPRGSLLAYCEARKTARGDWGAIDLLVRRSTDGGKTWSAPRPLPAVPGPHRKNPAALAQKLADPAAVTYNNPVAIPDPNSGVIHFLFCLEYMRCFHCVSDDDGRTFSPPVEITAAFDAFRPEYDWKVLATGPGHGLYTKGRRLVVPVWLSTGTGGHAHRPSVVATVYSDDGGRTWRRGAIAAREDDPLTNPSEAAVVQLSDDRVLLNIRSESKPHRRAVAVSPDGAANWTKPAFDDALVEPVCMASLCRLPGEKSRIVFANPHNLDRAGGKAVPGQGRDRKNLTLKLSYDDCRTWAVSKPLDPGPSGYSDLAAGPGGAIHCLYERGEVDGKNRFAVKALTLLTFDLDWLTDGKDRGPAPAK